jgi:hypothetical protein
MRVIFSIFLRVLRAFRATRGVWNYGQTIGIDPGAANLATREASGLDALQRAFDLVKLSTRAFLDGLQYFVVLQYDCRVRSIARQWSADTTQIGLQTLDSLAQLIASRHEQGTCVSKLFVADRDHGAMLAVPGAGGHSTRYL